MPKSSLLVSEEKTFLLWTKLGDDGTSRFAD